MTGAEYQTAIGVMQRIKDQAAPIKPCKDSSVARKFSGAIECTGFKADKLKQSEESLRTVMYLSYWGPN